MSVPAVLVARSPSASLSEYGEDVRDAGITSSGCIRRSPSDFEGQHALPQQGRGLDVCGGLGTQRTLFLTEKVTSASPSSSEMSCTEPTFMPDHGDVVAGHQSAQLVEPGR